MSRVEKSMPCVILRVWEKWAAVVGEKVVCVSTRKDRAILLWKAGDLRLPREIETFIFLTYFDRRIEVIRADELVGRGKNYRTAMRTSPKVGEDDKDYIAYAITVVRSAAWVEFPPKFQAHNDAREAWSKALDTSKGAAAASHIALVSARATLDFAVQVGREGTAGGARLAKAKAARIVETAHTLAEKANVAREREVRLAKARDFAYEAKVASNDWEMRQYAAYRARGEKRKMLMKQLKDEDDASRCYRSLGPVWQVFEM